MSSSGHQEESNTDTRTPARDTASGPLDHATEFPPVEMNSLQTDDAMGGTLTQQETNQSRSSTQQRHRAMRTDTVTAIENSRNPPLPPLSPTSQTAELNRTQSTAIGEPIETEPPPPRDVESTDAGPTLMITLLLLTGARHPFNLDAKYLAKRNVQVQGNDPFNLSIYKVKELILREWRDDWESKPSSPSAIRLISFGKVLDDKAAIKDLKFHPKAANVVHMSIKPQDFVEEEDAKGSKAARTRSRDGTEGRSPGCRCVIM